MAIDIMQPIRFSIDLGSGLVQTPLRMQLMKGDKKANRVIVVLTDGWKEADLTGVTVSGSFIRPGDAAEIPLVGTAEGNRAIVVLDDACYAQEGYCEINVALTMGGTKRTIVALTGNVLSKGSGAYVDVSGVIPSIDDIIAQYAEMKRVTEETQEAANAATTAASKAPYVDPISKNWMIWDASDGKYVDSGVTAQGEPGPQGPPGQNGTGSGTVTGVKVDGQTYQPDSSGVVTLPKSGAQIDDTSASTEKVYSSQKTQYELDQLSQQKANKAGWTANKIIGTDANGNLVAQDPPESGADLLSIYPVGSIYMSVNNTSPASLFGGTWEQLKDRFLLGAGDSYAAGNTGGAATVTINNSNMPYWSLYMGQASTDGEWSVGKWSDYSVKAGDTIPKYYGSDSGGSSSPLNNMPPYLAVYMWKRVS